MCFHFVSRIQEDLLVELVGSSKYLAISISCFDLVLVHCVLASQSFMKEKINLDFFFGGSIPFSSLVLTVIAVSDVRLLHHLKSSSYFFVHHHLYTREV